MSPLNVDTHLRLTAALTKAIGGFPGSLTPELLTNIVLATGVGLNQADVLYYARPTIAGSSTLSLDVATGGGLFNLYGDAIAMVKLKLICINAPLATCPNQINLSRPAAGVPFMLAASDAMVIRPGGMLLWIAPDLAGVPVTPTTADLVDIVNTAAGNVQPDIFLAGASS